MKGLLKTAAPGREGDGLERIPSGQRREVCAHLETRGLDVWLHLRGLRGRQDAERVALPCRRAMHRPMSGVVEVALEP